MNSKIAQKKTVSIKARKSFLAIYRIIRDNSSSKTPKHKESTGSKKKYHLNVNHEKIQGTSDIPF